MNCRGMLGILLRSFAVIIPVAVLVTCPSAILNARAESVWPALRLDNRMGDFQDPVHIAHAGDGSGRLFVVEQRGRILIVKDSKSLPVPFLDISDRVACCGERGLLSVAFPPFYRDKGYYYVNYTNEDGDTVIARFHVTANPDVSDAGSEEQVLFIGQPQANHNGGQIAFGPQDGYLYIGMGDCGEAGDSENRVQNPGLLLGKMLRIDVENAGEAVPSTTSAPGWNSAYDIPQDNPFVGREGHLGEIWALGLRNPWRFSFDRETADLYIGDVGQNALEEVDFQPADSRGGENYGWRALEGTQCYSPRTGCVPPANYSPPIFEYDRSLGISVIGGIVYRGSRFPGMEGIYSFADYVSGRIWGARRDGEGRWQVRQMNDTEYIFSSFGEDEAGNLYIASFSDRLAIRERSATGPQGRG